MSKEYRKNQGENNEVEDNQDLKSSISEQLKQDPKLQAIIEKLGKGSLEKNNEISPELPKTKEKENSR